MTAAACFGFPCVEVPPIYARIVQRANGAYCVMGLADSGAWEPLLRDGFGNALRYVSAEFARRALWRAAVKWDTQGVRVVYEGDEQCNF